jgi:(p)ppGpp synthase/HD superfamily hydrolase
MSDVAPFPTQPPAHQRQSKFTEANIRQIANLLERGKSNEEIAEIIGVTPATLKVSCSKLGISLRRPPSGALWRPRNLRTASKKNGEIQEMHEQNHGKLPTEKPNEQIQIAQKAPPVDDEQAMLQLHPKREIASRSDLCNVAFTMRYKGEERIIDIPFDRRVLGLFALEAEFRSMSFGSLIGQLLLAVGKNDMFDLVLEKSDRQPK